jgi:hypothetical protein
LLCHSGTAQPTNAELGFSFCLEFCLGCERQVVCKGCAVTLNGMRVIDNWASFKSSIPTTKSSGCATA